MCFSDPFFFLFILSTLFSFFTNSLKNLQEVSFSSCWKFYTVFKRDR
jgi:hypothetical protein